MIKKVFLTLCLLCSFALKSQNVESRIVKLINKCDVFTLDKEYPVVKDSLTPVNKWCVKALLDLNFNRMTDARISIDTLLSNYQSELGVANSRKFIFYSGYVLGELGLYRKGAELLKSFLDEVGPTVSTVEMDQHKKIYNFCYAFRNEKAPEIYRPLKDIELPVEFIEQTSVFSGVVTGNRLFVPVKIHGKSYRFLFDTGANYCAVPERIAREVGIRTLVDSVMVFGVKDSHGHKVGILDSISMGDIMYKNGLFVVTNAKLDSDSAFYSLCDGYVGLNFMRAIGEMIFYPNENRMVLPYKQTDLPIIGRNMTINDDRNVLVQAFTNDKPLLFHLDTGSTLTIFNYPYYLKNKEWFGSNPIKVSMRSSGVGGKVSYEICKSPEFSLKIGDLSFKLADMPTVIDPNKDETPTGDGVMGLDFFMPFSKVIMNFDKMFVEFKK